MATGKAHDFLQELWGIVESEYEGYADLSLLGQLGLVRRAKNAGVFGQGGRLRSFLEQHTDWFLIDDDGFVTLVHLEGELEEVAATPTVEVCDDWWPQPQREKPPASVPQPTAKDKQVTGTWSALTATTRPYEFSPYAKPHAPATVTTTKADTASQATATWAGRATATARWRESAVSTVTERCRSSDHERWDQRTTATVRHTDRFLAPATTGTAERGSSARRGGRDRDTSMRLGAFPTTGGGPGWGRGRGEAPSQAANPSPWELAKAIHGPDLGVRPTRVGTNPLTGAAARQRANGWDVDETPPWPQAGPPPPVAVSHPDTKAVAAEWPDLAPSPAPRGRTNSPTLPASRRELTLPADTQHPPTTEMPGSPLNSPQTLPADTTPPPTPRPEDTTPTTATVPDGWEEHSMADDSKHSAGSEKSVPTPDTQAPSATETNPPSTTTHASSSARDQSSVSTEHAHVAPCPPTPTPTPTEIPPTTPNRRQTLPSITTPPRVVERNPPPPTASSRSTRENFLRSVFMSGPGDTTKDRTGGFGRVLWGEKDVERHTLAQYGTLGVVGRQPATCTGAWPTAHWGTPSADGVGEVNGSGGEAGTWTAETTGLDGIKGEGFGGEKIKVDVAGTSRWGVSGDTPTRSGDGDVGASNCTEPEMEHELVFLNTNEPFCAVAVGVQGSGKSHSLLSVIENCMLHCPPVTHVPTPTATLVFHYDSDPTNMCEAVRLASPAPAELFPPGMPRPTVQRVVVLLSPSFYFQRRVAYAHVPNCTVHPLLLGWDDLTAEHLKAIMRVDSHRDDQPLYMGVLLDILRRLQKGGQKHSFPDFRDVLMTASFERQQGGPLTQRLRLLESLLAESEENRGAPFTVGLADWLDPGTLVVADLTDPMLAPDEANGIFQVLLSQFLSAPTACPKLAVFDEAHKYLSPHGRRDPLSNTIVHTVRQMRHHGIRVAVSSQSPHTLPPELLELTSVALIHRFHSKDWFDYLQKKLTLAPSAFGEVMALPPGTALCFSSRWAADLEGGGDAEGYGHGVRKLHVRQRLTAPSGRSKVGNY